MKHLALPLMALGFSSLVSAKTINLKCEVTYNTSNILTQEVKFDTASTRSLSIGEVENFEFFLTNTQGGAVELQALNTDEPSRTYATAKLNGAGSFVQLSIWTRSFVMESRCTSL